MQSARVFCVAYMGARNYMADILRYRASTNPKTKYAASALSDHSLLALGSLHASDIEFPPATSRNMRGYPRNLCKRGVKTPRLPLYSVEVWDHNCGRCPDPDDRNCSHEIPEREGASRRPPASGSSDMIPIAAGDLSPSSHKQTRTQTR